jgi:hypothetical protein
LDKLGEDGLIQTIKPEIGGSMWLGAVGQLQFEVVQRGSKPRNPSLLAKTIGMGPGATSWVCQSCDIGTCVLNIRIRMYCIFSYAQRFFEEWM